MEHPCTALDESGDADLDPRIQIELEKLNSATDEINRLEIELDEANTTFRLLLNESTRRLKLLSKKLGSCIECARPYYDSLEVAKKAQLECQRAAVQFQRANGIHQAAKETVALAEQRFLSKQHEWQFDNAWQEMLNHATIKVMDAENQKAESGREHQKRATLFNAAEQKVQQLEQRLHRSITKSRPYFEEKALCQGQLATQKERVETLQHSVANVKSQYAESLRELERISEEIHYKRGSGCLRKVTDDFVPPHGPREPGVGAELNVFDVSEFGSAHCGDGTVMKRKDIQYGTNDATNKFSALTDYELELDRCDLRSVGSLSVGTSSAAVSEIDDSEVIDDGDYDQEEDLETLKQRLRELAVRPVDGGEGQSSDSQWEEELTATVNRLDRKLMQHESIVAAEMDGSIKTSSMD